MTTVATMGVLAALPFALCPPTVEEDLMGFQVELSAQFDLGPDAEAMQHAWETVAGGKGNPAEVGMWAAPKQWPVIAIHAAMMPDGRVLHYSYPNATPGTRATLWDPETDTFTDVNWIIDIFCSGLTFLPNGRLLVVGGNAPGCTFTGYIPTQQFDAEHEQWAFTGDMVDGRWYPNVTRMGDGSVMITSGLNTACETNQFMERFVLGEGPELIPTGSFNHQLFPRIHLLTSGNLVRVGQENWTYMFNTQFETWQFAGVNNFGWRCEGTSVMIPNQPNRILAVGGNCPLTNTAEIYEFGLGDQPSWTYTTPMHHARAHADSLILPDGTIMIIGGGQLDLYGQPIFVPEIYDPVTETWTEMATHVFGRMYHGTTVLLPDGRVLIAGQDSGQSMFYGELYSPPYLFRGARPQLANTPTRVAYGRDFSIEVPDAGQIDSVALVAPTAVTHSVNTNQRYAGLDFEVLAGNTIRATAPPNGNHAPPGFYMLFVVNDQGVPAVAEFVQVIDFPLGDLDGDGFVATTDFLTLLGEWGLCPGCDSDLDGNGIVEVNDFLALLMNWTQ